MTAFTDDDVTATVDTLIHNGGEPGSSLHSWRCEDKARYPEPCTCLNETALSILAAVLPAHDKRVRAEALREAADDLPMDGPLHIMDRQVHQDFLRARADAEENK